MTKTIPFNDISVPSPGFGAMSFSGVFGPAEDETSLKTLKTAYDLGCRFWDTAVVYGFGHNETLIGEFLKQNPGSRENLFIGSKCGWDIDFDKNIRHGVTNSAEHINTYIEGTIERLGTTPDLYYLHRIELGRDLKESIGALDGLKKAGKTKYIGLSECSADTLRKACAIAHIDALQIEYSPFYTGHEDNDLISTAKELGVAIVAFSPLGKGLLTGKYTSRDDFAPNDYRRTVPSLNEENFEANLKIVREFERLSAKKGCTPGQLSLAWVAAQGAIAIPGTKTSSRLEENFKSSEVDLTEEELKEIRAVIVGSKPQGARYSEAQGKFAGH